MRIILVEFLWHAKEIVNKKSSFKDDVIVSLDPESSYFLKTNKISYFETYEFCINKDLWSRYKDITEQSIKVTEELDKTLFNTEERFKRLEWKLFNDYYYVFKISFDQLFYYSELITKLIERFRPSEIIVADTGKILIDKYFLIDSRISVIKYLLETIKDNKNKINFVFQPKKDKSFYSFFYNKKELIFTCIAKLKNETKNIYYKINFLTNYYLYRPKYLSIGCIEIDRYKKIYPNNSKSYINYQKGDLPIRFKNNKIFLKNFIDILKNNPKFAELIKYKEISFELVFYEILSKFVKQLDFLIKEYKNVKKIIEKTKPKCVIFQSLAPFYLPNVLFKKACVDFKIPFATWSHGGCGLTYSITPYDVTDFRSCKNHITYGPYLSDLIEDEKCVLNKLDLKKNQKIFPVGSFRFDYDNKNKKIKKKENKKIIFFLMGFNYKRNNFYFGRNRERRETLLWESIYEILCILKKFQNKYNIIFKDYPEGRKGLWKGVLKNIGADKISYISKESTVNDLLRISDLNIMPWISSTFFEALYFDSDIFVLEEDVFEKPFRQELKDEIFYFNKDDEFKFNLDKYLEEGHFYKCKKYNSKKYLLNLDNINNRDRLLSDALSNITNN